MAEETEKLNTEEAVALTMLADVVMDNPEAVASILQAHGDQATGDPEIDFLKVLALTEERGRYFTEDFEKMTAEKCKYFGTGLALTIASKLGGKLKDKIKDKLDKRKEEGKPGIKDLLKKVFKKKDDGTSKTGQEIADDEDAKKLDRLAGGGGDDETEDDDKPKPKPILGMHPALFFSLLTIIILVIIFLIVRGMRKKKKPSEAKG